MSRGVFLLGFSIAVLALAFAMTDFGLSRQPGITQANCARILPGMTLSEVEALLGREASFEHPMTLESRQWGVVEYGQPGERVQKSWVDDCGMADVSFGADGRALRAWFTPGDLLTERPGIIARLRSWLGW